MDFLLGTGVILAPSPPIGLVCLAAICVGKGIQGLRRRHKASNAPLSDGAASAPDQRGVAVQVAAVQLAWNDITATLALKDGTTKPLLQGVAGAATPGRLLALMGPSGSGKTTLLNTLSGHMPKSSNLRITGAITVNGVPSAKSHHRQAYVEQNDQFYSMLSVSETLEMASQLQLPEGTSPEERAALVDRLTAVLGLGKVVSTVVGDEKKRGLSGGERKRLAIGCELISAPSLLFLDEPTTGLDSFQASRVMGTLKELAAAGHTVVVSIHQPSSSIFAAFDDLLCLSEGRQVYGGAAAAAIDHFAALGHVCPQHYNPAEFIADLISLDSSSPAAEEESRSRVQSLATAWQRARSSEATAAAAAPAAAADGGAVHALVQAQQGPTSGWWRQFRLLATRSWRQVTRDRATFMARLSSNLSSALVFGAIFWRMRRKQSNIQDRMGLLQVCAINAAMSSMIKTLQVFPNERVIVSRERAKHAYSTLPYLSAKLLAELPMSALFPLIFGGLVYPTCGLNPRPIRFLRFLGILTLESFAATALGLVIGSFAPSADAAVAIGPAVMLVFIVFGGYYVNASNVPGALKWLPRASLIKQGFEALCINEFTGLEFEPDERGRGMLTGAEVLEWLSFNNTSIKSAMVQEGRILLFFYWATLHILRAKKPAFQEVEAPAKNTEEEEAPLAAAASS